MASDFAIPESLPLPLRAGHSLRPEDIAKTVEMDQGEARRRWLYRSVPEVVTLSWWLTQEQFDDFHAFYEDTLAVAARRFDLRVAKQGNAADIRRGEASWWAAIFASPYSASIVPTKEGVCYRVDATLKLFGPPADYRVAPGIRASGTNARDGFARMTQPAFRASGTNARDGGWRIPAIPFAASGENVRDGGWYTDVVTGDARLTESGDIRITESGDTRIIE